MKYVRVTFCIALAGLAAAAGCGGDDDLFGEASATGAGGAAGLGSTLSGIHFSIGRRL